MKDIIYIPLSRNKFAIIDWSDWKLVMNFKWHTKSDRGKMFYAATSLYKNGKSIGSITMHRLIMGGYGVDHANRNGLDNRRCNLRIATRSQNRANSLGNTASGFKGVYRQQDRWQAQIRVNGRIKSLGYFNDPALAGAAYKAGAEHYFGQFART